MSDLETNVIVPEIIDEYCLSFWDGLREERLLLGRCHSCSKFHFYPRVRCPFCGSADTKLEAASGMGTIVSFTSVHRTPRPSHWGVPYVLALVRLDEGPRLLTAMDCAEESCTIGMPVRVVYKAVGSGDQTLWLHQFTPVDADASSP